jgi:putative DNA primase/helicase
MDNREFYALFGDEVIITTLPDRKHYRIPAGEVTDRVAELGLGRNVYINPNPRRADLPAHLRGEDDDVERLIVIVADVDVFGPAHKENDLPPDKTSAMAFLNEMKIKPTGFVDSGYGIYGYYLFKAPIRLSDEETLDRAKGINRGFGRMLIDEATKRGWKLDNVYNISHMFRAPGSLNHKLDEPVPCEIISFDGPRYTIEDFAEYYEKAPSFDREPFEADPESVGSASRIMERCAFVQKLKDDPNGVTEPEWKAMCDNISLVPDGAELFHEWSALYDGYSFEETERKIARSQKVKRPVTCRYIKENLCFNCPEGGCGVKAPIVHALLSPHEQLEMLLSKKSMDEETALADRTLALAVYARDNAPALYARLKQLIRTSGVGIRDFENVVKFTAKKAVEPKFDSVQAEISLDGIDLHGAVEPAGYEISIDDGVCSTATINGYPVKTKLCNQPIVITARLENIDSGTEMMELAFMRNGKWKNLRAPRSSLFNKTSLVKFADSGLLVSSDNSEGLVRYFTDYESENNGVIPFIRSVGRIGWIGKKEFYPYVTDGEVIFDGDDGEEILPALSARGDFAVWLETAKALRVSDVSRAMLAASFVSPMLYPLQNRIINLHFWYASGSGKTAALKFALSVWGNPLKLMGNFNSTAVGLERRAGTLKHLPLGLDELQVLNEKRLSSSTIVYSLGNGYGKTRGSRNGGLQEVPTWLNSIISTGEQPISNETSMDGVNTRVLEVYGQPIEDAEYGRYVHQVSEDNYGFAGEKFIRYLIEKVLTEKGKLDGDYAELRGGLKSSFEMLDIGDPGAHLDNIAAIALADRYSSECLFGMSEKQATVEAMQLGMALLHNCKSLEKEDSVDRAWHFVEGWLAENKTRFDTAVSPCYGKIEKNCVYVIASVLREALEYAGFIYTKCIKGFRDRDYIEVFANSEGSRNCQCQKRIQGVNVRAVCLKVEVQTDGEEFL